ncbi:MAG: hypothetical protein M5U08_16595 [Burkholderiales bacterium]|nr:hypothetical protein [Burkholderiales bacterium]
MRSINAAAAAVASCCGNAESQARICSGPKSGSGNDSCPGAIKFINMLAVTLLLGTAEDRLIDGGRKDHAIDLAARCARNVDFFTLPRAS